jgi:hypothetical protein
MTNVYQERPAELPHEKENIMRSGLGPIIAPVAVFLVLMWFFIIRPTLRELEMSRAQLVRCIAIGAVYLIASVAAVVGVRQPVIAASDWLALRTHYGFRSTQVHELRVMALTRQTLHISNGDRLQGTAKGVWSITCATLLVVTVVATVLSVHFLLSHYAGATYNACWTVLGKGKS